MEFLERVWKWSSEMSEINGINLEMAVWKSIDHKLAMFGVNIGVKDKEQRVGAVMRQTNGEWNWQIFGTQLQGVAQSQEAAQAAFDKVVIRLVDESRQESAKSDFGDTGCPPDSRDQDTDSDIDGNGEGGGGSGSPADDTEDPEEEKAETKKETKNAGKDKKKNRKHDRS